MNQKLITSTSNQLLKDIRKLHQRKERFRTGRFLLEGIRIVGDALAHHAHVEVLLYSPELLNSDFALGLIREYGGRVEQVLELSEEAFRYVAKKDNPQGLAAVARMGYQSLGGLTVETDDIWVVLDTIRDPGNLGTILRTMDGIKGTGVILLDDCVDAYDPTAVRAGMGGHFTQHLVTSTFEQFAGWIHDNNFWVVGTSDHVGRKHYREISYQQPTFLLMGSERAGLPDSHLAICDETVFIPMYGSCDSLNLSVATGIVLYEITHQLRGASS
jgi:TrmH family RNA methyltransferase